MSNSYYYNILFFAFENLVKCEGKYELDLDKFSDFRKVVVSRVKENYDSLTMKRSDTVKEKLKKFIIENEKMSKEDEARLLDLFLTKYKALFERKNNTIYLKKKVPYEDIAEVRYLEQRVDERDVLLSIYRESISFDAYEALGTTSILNDIKKIIEVEKNVEEAFYGDINNETKNIINIGSMFVKGKLISIIKRGYNIIDEYYSNLVSLASRANNHDWITDKILSDKIRSDDVLFLDNIYIDDEFSNLFQKAIFDDEVLVYKSLINYFDDIWDYINKDDEAASERVENILYDIFGDEDLDCDCDLEDVDDKVVDNANKLFYLKYISILNKLIDMGFNELIDTKNRLLYAMNYYDSNYMDNKYLSNSITKLNNNDYEMIHFHSFYVMSRLMLIDILDNNNYDSLIKKVIFISTYYQLTNDIRIFKILNSYHNSSLGSDLSNIILNKNYNELFKLSKTAKTKIKKKEDS